VKLTQIQTTTEDHRIAKLAAFAIALHMFEAVIPSPCLALSLALPISLTLYVLYQYGFATAAWVSILRVFASSLLLGQFLSPTFILSFKWCAIKFSCFMADHKIA